MNQAPATKGNSAGENGLVCSPFSKHPEKKRNRSSKLQNPLEESHTQQLLSLSTSHHHKDLKLSSLVHSCHSSRCKLLSNHKTQQQNSSPGRENDSTQKKNQKKNTHTHTQNKNEKQMSQMKTRQKQRQEVISSSCCLLQGRAWKRSGGTMRDNRQQ